MNHSVEEYDGRIQTIKAELKRVRILRKLQEIKEAGLRGPGRPRRVLPVGRERVLELRSQGLSLRKIASTLTQEIGLFVSQSAIADLLHVQEVIQ